MAAIVFALPPRQALATFAILVAVLLLFRNIWTSTSAKGRDFPILRPTGCAEWDDIAKQTNQICVLGRTFQGQYPVIPTFLASLSHGSVPLKLLLLITDHLSPREELEHTVRDLSALLGCPEFATVLPGVTQKDADAQRARHLTQALLERCPDGCMDWGYAFTDAALDNLFGPNNSANRYGCRWLLVTNTDNLYATGFTSSLAPYMYGGGPEGPADLLGWDFSSRYNSGDWTQALLRNSARPDDVVGIGPHYPMLSAFYERAIDLGAMLVRVEFFLGQRDAEGKPLRFLPNAIHHHHRGVFNTTKRGQLALKLSDGLMARELASRTTVGGPGQRRGRVILRQMLMLHQ